MARFTWRFISCHVMAGCNHRFISCQGTLLISKYGITVLILMIMVHFMVTLLHGGYTCFMIGFMLCTVQVIVFLTLCRLNC